MRVIVYGVGAIGGTVAVALARSGAEVVGIARGPQLDAMRDHGLTLLAPKEEISMTVPVVAQPSEIPFRPDDCILLTMKTQDTAEALGALRDAGVTDQPIFCAQNGVTNERLAARIFPNVHGVAVMMPATFLEPGRAIVHVAPRFGIFDLGQFPLGETSVDMSFAALLEAANIAAFPQADVMASKYGKLLLNLSNILEALMGHGAARGDLPNLLRAEALTVYDAAGIAYSDVGVADPRRDALIRWTDVTGAPRKGGSTTQSLLRGTGRLETDWLNGEIALLGRLHGVPTPLNAALCRLGAQLARGDLQHGTLTLEDLEHELRV
ncbi:MAG: 2-dehydropantoate 2-reductase N-terminal domain-containing protein [Pseudomonadota bacterium]